MPLLDNGRTTGNEKSENIIADINSKLKIFEGQADIPSNIKSKTSDVESEASGSQRSKSSQKTGSAGSNINKQNSTRVKFN